MVSLGISFLVLGIAVSVISSINRAVQRSADLGRSSQVFFAAEAGLEGAFYHHNARGQGVHFVGTPVPQTLDLPNASAEVTWEIEGRSDPVAGLLKEGQKIQIPLYWDDSVDPTFEPPLDGNGDFDPTHDQAGKLSDDFVLTFSTSGIPSDFDFGTTTDAVLLDWSISREHSINGFQTFVPLRGTGLVTCSSGTSFICKDDFLVGGASIDSFNPVPGKIVPGGTVTEYLDDFMQDLDSQKFVLSFQSLLPFIDTDSEEKIKGISFSVEADDSTALPKENYQVTANVSLGDFSKTITAIVPEKATIGAFDYVIFD